MKKLIFAATMLLAAWQTIAAQDSVTIDGVVYNWDATRSGYWAAAWDAKTPIRHLRIHAEVNGLNVVGVKDDAFNFDFESEYSQYSEKPPIESLVIEEGVESIGYRAFVDCTDLRSAYIGSSVTVINDDAFFRCSALETLVLNEGLKTIGPEAFANCTALTTVVIPASVRDIHRQAFLGCTGVTDAYFLMEDSELNGFDWWDGTVEHNGGKEFNTNANTIIRVPKGLRQAYIDSGKFSAWLRIEEDENIHPLWWIVNYGTVGATYTVSDDLTGVYVDKNDALYAKDDNMWLAPDLTGTGEVDYMRSTGLLSNRGNVYDQSNWVALTGIASPQQFINHKITGGTITGVLRDKVNPCIEVASTSTPVKGAADTYVPNTYIPASVMTRTQTGPDGSQYEGIVYAFVRPKPQEYADYKWTVYGDNNEFYMPAPEPPLNPREFVGGFGVSYDLYEAPPVPTLNVDYTYPFKAITRRLTTSSSPAPRFRLKAYTTTEGGEKTTEFEVYPLELPSSPVTAVTDIPTNGTVTGGRYNILGQPVGDDYKGIVIENGRKLIVR